MKLLSIKYTSHYKDGWELESLVLDSNINLIVGQNTTGKSKTIHLLSTLAYLITGFDSEVNIPVGIWECRFLTDEEKILDYHCEIEIGNFTDTENLDIPLEFRVGTTWYIAEKLTIGGDIVLEREGTEGTIFSFKKMKLEEIAPPFDELVIQVRRDKKEYPFFEELIKWSKSFKLFEFSNIQSIQNKSNEYRQIGKLLNVLPNKIKDEIIKDIQKVGYNIEDLIIDKTWDNKYYFWIKEVGIQEKIYESHISQGLMRTIALLVFIEYSIHFDKVSTLAIDDIGEGLDYERATKLGKLLVEKIENSNIQLIATSNDSFLMDVIPIKYWNILHREGNVVKSFNYQNSKELFDNFAFTGLSNFDLFSSDYLLQKT